MQEDKQKSYCLHGYGGSHIGRKESAVSLDSGTIAGSKNHQFKSGDRQFKVAIATSKWRSLLQSGDRYFKVAIATSKWRSLVQSSESPVQSGDRQFKVANRQLKVAIATS